MAVNLSLTNEQVAILLPLLQQVTKPAGTAEKSAISYPNAAASPLSLESSGFSPSSLSRTPSSSSSYDSSNTDSPANSSFEGIGYNLIELLRRKKKNSKSTEAQNFLHVRL